MAGAAIPLAVASTAMEAYKTYKDSGPKSAGLASGSSGSGFAPPQSPNTAGAAAGMVPSIANVLGKIGAGQSAPGTTAPASAPVGAAPTGGGVVGALLQSAQAAPNPLQQQPPNPFLGPAAGQQQYSKFGQ
jgi:hypothetical protein